MRKEKDRGTERLKIPRWVTGEAVRLRMKYAGAECEKGDCSDVVALA